MRTTTQNKILAVLAAAAVVSTGLNTASAQTISFTNTAGGDWNTSTNWASGAGPVPGASNTASFGVATSGNITASAAIPTISTLFLSTSANATFNLGSQTLTMTEFSGSANIANDAKLLAGTMNATNFTVGSGASSRGFTIDGSSSLVNVATRLAVGRSTGTTAGASNILNLQNGADIASGGSHAVYVGWHNTATNSLAANSNQLNVTGAGTTMSNVNELYIGYSDNTGTGNGGASSNSMTVNNGATVATSGSVRLGFRSSGSAAVNSNTLTIGGSGTGSALTVGTTLLIGPNGGFNTVTVNTGGTLTATGGNTTLTNSASDNLLDVNGGTFNGSGRTLFANDILRVRGNGTVQTGLLDMASTGSIDFQHGLIQAGNATINGSAPAFAVGNNSGSRDATLSLASGGTHTFSSGLTLNSDGVVEFSGSGVVGSLTTTALTSNGRIEFKLGRSGGTPVSDSVVATTSVSLLGSADLWLTLGGLSAASENDIFYLVNNQGGSAVSGNFTSLNGAATTLTEGSIFTWNSQSWQITYQASFGSSFTGGNDIALMAVPEPTSAVLVGAAGACVLFLRRRRRQA